MSYLNLDSEDAAIEKPTKALFAELGWETLNCYQENFGPLSLLGRETMADVALPYRLHAAIEKLNPGVSHAAIEIAVQELAKDRNSMSPARANQSVYRILKDGVKVNVPSAGDDERRGRRRDPQTLSTGTNSGNNDFLLDFAVLGQRRLRQEACRPRRLRQRHPALSFIELKASHKKRWTWPTTKNLSDYKDTVPQIFWFNSIVILSNGSKARIGSMTAGFEHFAEWKKIDDEKEPGLISLETMIRGVCDKRKLLDLVENFILFDERKGELNKLRRQEPPIPWRQQRHRRRPEHREEPRQPWGLLAYSGVRQELFDGVLQPKGAAEDPRQLDLRDRHRPGGPGWAKSTGTLPIPEQSSKTKNAFAPIVARA